MDLALDSKLKTLDVGIARFHIKVEDMEVEYNSSVE